MVFVEASPEEIGNELGIDGTLDRSQVLSVLSGANTGAAAPGSWPPAKPARAPNSLRVAPGHSAITSIGSRRSSTASASVKDSRNALVAA